MHSSKIPESWMRKRAVIETSYMIQSSYRWIWPCLQQDFSLRHRSSRLLWMTVLIINAGVVLMQAVVCRSSLVSGGNRSNYVCKYLSLSSSSPVPIPSLPFFHLMPAKWYSADGSLAGMENQSLRPHDCSPFSSYNWSLAPLTIFRSD